MADKICVSIFVSENADGTVAIKSLAADDKISKAIERMTCEQIENLLKYIIAAGEAVKAVKLNAQADGSPSDPVGRDVGGGA